MIRMEYLNSIDDNLQSINEDNIIYYDLANYPSLLYGDIDVVLNELSFSRMTSSIKDSFKNHPHYNNIIQMEDTSYSMRLRFSTDSDVVIFKVEYEDMLASIDGECVNSCEFNVYSVEYGNYKHECKFTPSSDCRIFAQSVELEYNNNQLCIFLPSYAKIHKIYIGIKEECSLEEFDYCGINQIPLIFCSDEVSMGFYRQECGESYPDIVSRIFDQDIINVSFYDNHSPNKHMCELVGRLNCEAIIVAFDGHDEEEFLYKFKEFYETLRAYHEDTPLIFLTSYYIKDIREFDENDEIIIELFNKWNKNDENIALINLKQLLAKNKSNKDDMNIIAEEICKHLQKY